MNAEDFASMMRGMWQALDHMAGHQVEGRLVHTSQEIATRRATKRLDDIVKACRKR